MLCFLTPISFGLAFLSVFLVTGVATVPALHLNHRVFADDLTLRLYGNENECSSALGVSMAFSLIYPSTNGSSTTEISTVLGYPEGESPLQLVWNDTATRLDEAYQGACLPSYNGNCMNEEPTLEIANTVWIDDDDALDPLYFDVVGSYLRQIDFADSSAGGLINEWVNEATKGLIDSIVPDGPLLNLLLVAINSIYLKANWRDQFSEAYTNEDVFYPGLVARVSSQAYFMHKIGNFYYSHEALPGYQVLQMRFKAGNLAMLLVLPGKNDTGAASSVDVMDAVPQLRETRMALALPKFQFESQYRDNLKDSLKSLGIVAPFSPGLCIFENDCSAFIDSIIQKTYIAVDENGIEAAAVTVILVPTAPPPNVPVLFQADHPFQFFIYDTTEQLVVFEGRVGDPGIPEGAPTPQLQATHEDTNFWSTTFGVNPIVVDLSQATAAPTPASTAAPTPMSTTASTAAPTPMSTTTSTAGPTSSVEVPHAQSLGFLYVTSVLLSSYLLLLNLLA